MTDVKAFVKKMSLFEKIVLFGMIVFLVVGGIATIYVKHLYSENHEKVERFDSVAAIQAIEEGKFVTRENKRFSAAEMSNALQKNYLLFSVKRHDNKVEYIVKKPNILDGKAKTVVLENDIENLTDQDVEKIFSACDGGSSCKLEKMDDKTLIVNNY